MEWVKGKYVTVQGVRVRYIEVGEGPAVLLLHGLGTSLITWYRNVDALESAGFKVLALDLPGYGYSDKPRHLDYGPVAGAEFLREFLDALNVQQVSVVGNSAGGLIVGLFALTYPERVDRVVLVASGGLGRRLAWYLRVISVPGLGEVLYQPRLQNLVDLSKRIFYRSPSCLKEVLPEMHRVRTLPGSRYAAIRSIRSSVNLFGLRKQQHILDRLKHLSRPLLTVWGAEDTIIPVSHATQLRKTLPYSVVRILPQCGHWPHMEKAEEFNDLLIKFLGGRLDRQARPSMA